MHDRSVAARGRSPDRTGFIRVGRTFYKVGQASTPAAGLQPRFAETSAFQPALNLHRDLLSPPLAARLCHRPTSVRAVSVVREPYREPGVSETMLDLRASLSRYGWVARHRPFWTSSSATIANCASGAGLPSTRLPRRLRPACLDDHAESRTHARH